MHFLFVCLLESDENLGLIVFVWLKKNYRLYIFGVLVNIPFYG